MKYYPKERTRIDWPLVAVWTAVIIIDLAIVWLIVTKLFKWL